MICKIVIPTTGNAVMLERLLQPWAASSFCWDAIEIVVAQNGEGESCEKELAAYKKSLPIRHVHFTPPCKNHALNQVIEEDPGAFIMLGWMCLPFRNTSEPRKCMAKVITLVGLSNQSILGDWI
jgi:hypothetical protein